MYKIEILHCVQNDIINYKARSANSRLAFYSVFCYNIHTIFISLEISMRKHRLFSVLTKQEITTVKLRFGNKSDKEYILNMRPHAAALFEGCSYFIVAEDDEILGFAVVINRDIVATIVAKEAFINLIEILDEHNFNKGIASRLVQRIIKLEEKKNTYQIRAYCDIKNVASHCLWLKNGFGIAPIKQHDGQILGSFVTYVCK